jgi:O-antigen ligase
VGRFRLGLADAVGATVLACVVLVTPLGAPATTARFIALVAGAAAMAPAVVSRLRVRGVRDLGPLPLTVISAAWGLVVWSVVSGAVHSGETPWQQWVYGWFGRGGGVLTSAAGAVLLTAAALLRTAPRDPSLRGRAGADDTSARDEVARALAWITVGATICAVAVLVQIGVPDFLATSDEAGRPGTMGNSNFAGAVCGIAVVLALWLGWRCAAARASVLARSLWTVSALLLAAGTVAAGAVQGPVTALIGCAVSGAALLWVRGVRWIPWAVGVAVTAGVITAVLSLRDIGPLAWVWQEPTMQARVVYWRTAFATMTAEPLFGAGPDSFAVAVAQFRPTDYLVLRGPDHYVSAAHSVPLQTGATIGVPGLLLWLIVVVGAAAAGLRGLVPRSGATILVGAVGAWTAYIAQSLISIDQIGLLAVGATLTGAVLAASGGRAADRAASASARGGSQLQGRAVRSAMSAGCVVLVLLVCAPAVSATVRGLAAPPSAEVVTSPWTPCALRVSAAQGYAATHGSSDAARTVRQAYAIDPTCPRLGLVVARAELSAGDPAAAQRVLADVLARDPHSTWAWILDGAALARLGDAAAARSVLEQARALARYTPGEFRDALAALEREIDAA